MIQAYTQIHARYVYKQHVYTKQTHHRAIATEYIIIFYFILSDSRLKSIRDKVVLYTIV